MGIYNINTMDITKVAEHMNTELKKGRTQKDIELMILVLMRRL